METTVINCPHCGSTVNVNEVLYSQVQETLSKEFNTRLNDEKKQFQKRSDELEKEKMEIEKLKSGVKDEIASGISRKLISEKEKLEKTLRDRISEEKSEEIKAYKEQLDEKIKETKEHNRLKADFQKLQREKTELKEKIEAEAELKITSMVDRERAKIKKEVEEKNELKISEKEHVINQLRNQLKIAQKQADQGSMQVQGEVMETGLEDYLNACFPFDEIQEVKKGSKGADCFHVVNTPISQSCGSILYEAKRTKDFQPAWISKLKEDMQARNATIGVLVTETYPPGIERLSLVNGVWICSYEEVKGLCFVLREAIILLHNARMSQVDKGSKMEILYEYMVSNEFRMQIEAIVECFSEMQNNLLRERRAMESIWKQREKQIQKVLLNTSHIYSSVRGIAGNAIGAIKQLELESSEKTSSKKLLSNNFKSK